MTKSRTRPGILIGVFDDAANLERVYARSGATLPCYVDDGTAEAYFDVRTLPFELVMSDG